MRVGFSLVKGERAVYGSDLGSRARIFISERLAENAKNNYGYRDKKSDSDSVFAKFSPQLILEKACDVFHRLFLRLV